MIMNKEIDKKPIKIDEIEKLVAWHWEAMGCPDNSGGDRCKQIFVEMVVALMKERIIEE